MEDAHPPLLPTLQQRLDGFESRLDDFGYRLNSMDQRQESIYRAQCFMVDAFRAFTLHYPRPSGFQFPSSAEFHAYTGWPGGQPSFFGGDSVAAASGEDDDDEEENVDAGQQPDVDAHQEGDDQTGEDEPTP